MQKNIMLFDYPLVFFYVISRCFILFDSCGTLILYLEDKRSTDVKQAFE